MITECSICHYSTGSGPGVTHTICAACARDLVCPTCGAVKEYRTTKIGDYATRTVLVCPEGC